MAPRESIKATPKVQRTVSKTKPKASPISTIKKTMATRKLVDATQIKVTNTTVKTRASMAPPCTPKPKESKPVPTPSSVTKSAKKVRKPKAAHSGVPVPSKMLKLMKLQAAGGL
ncbi:histone H1-like [Cydia fagiglandana]|uniref:histone H1-like n=1 Tax=Cydia fagiglandana TaxID=1458189 RepID=UPI002FEE319A